MVSKNVTSIAIEQLEGRVERREIRIDYPLQRESGQWSTTVKNDFIVSLLRGDHIFPLVIARQTNDKGGRVEWLIDGKQRLTTAILFRQNAFKIGRSVDRPIVTYSDFDENGEPCLKEFNVTNKYYRDLPEALRNQYDSYNFDCQVEDCNNDDDVEYHIRRYNHSKPMTAPQKGITHLGEELAKKVKEFKGERFFLDGIGFKANDHCNGAIERCIIESVMSSFHLEDWKSGHEKICKYLRENSSVMEFNEIGDMLDQLGSIMDDNIGKLFTTKDTFLWLAVFNEFLNMDKDLSDFRNFLTDYVNHNVDTSRYDSVSERATKDKGVVTRRINALIAIMKDYFGEDNNEKEIKHEEKKSSNKKNRAKKVDVNEEVEDDTLPFAVDDLAC